ncbi:MauE/DoxX family redox-associated membrane protein [Actinophytocola sp.]|uniref:MauE/DoxX family redox-associated membrane protein n=1 Tax=Actinophytocola sp. TaxID=1872138 RepID=UPI003D6AADFA
MKAAFGGTHVLMVTAVALAIATGGGLVLVAAGVGHARRFDPLRAILASQALLPHRWQRPVAHLLVAAELVVGLAVVVAGLAPNGGPGIVFAVEGGLYVAMLAYAVVLYRRRPAVPCGCFGDDGPASLPSVMRTGILAAGAGVAAAVTSSPGAHAAVPLPLLASGAVAIAALAYVVPGALRTVDTEGAGWTH